MAVRARSLSVTEFEASADAALRRARAGEVVEITAKGKPVAHIVPVAPRRNTPEQERAILERNADMLNAEAAACIEDQAGL